MTDSTPPPNPAPSETDHATAHRLADKIGKKGSRFTDDERTAIAQCLRNVADTVAQNPLTDSDRERAWREIAIGFEVHMQWARHENKYQQPKGQQA